MSVSLSVRLSVLKCMFSYVCVHMIFTLYSKSLNMSVCLSICLPACLTVCLIMSMSVCFHMIYTLYSKSLCAVCGTCVF